MKVDSQVSDLLGLPTVDFILTPISLSTAEKPHNDEHIRYIFELEKGPQLIHRFQQTASFHQNQVYYFRQQEKKSFRIHNKKESPYSLSIYRLQHANEVYIHSFPLNILEAFRQYKTQVGQHKDDYSFVKDRIESGFGLGKSWKALKAELNNHQQVLISTDSQTKFELKYTVQIITAIDRYDQAHPEMIRVKTQSSWGSKKSVSSLQSKARRKQEPPTQSQDRSQIKPEHKNQEFLQREDTSQLKINEQLKNYSKLTTQVSTPILQTSQEQSKKIQTSALILPTQSLINKKIQILSDIAEQSNEAQSVLTHGTNTTRKWKDLPQNKEFNIIMAKSKTQQLINQKKKTKEFKKRISLEEDLNQKGMKQKGSYEKASKAKVRFDISQEEFIQSRDQNEPQNSTQFQFEMQTKNWTKIICIICICWFFISLLAVLGAKKDSYSHLQTIKHIRIPKGKVQASNHNNKN